jgi:predicted NBD/HSP70 family sugar kinase
LPLPPPPLAASPWNAATAIPPWQAWIDDAGLDGAVRAYGAILSGQATTRAALSELLGVRSTTMSAWVAAMVRQRLVTELASRPGARGRPLQHLVADPNRLVAIVLMVHSKALHGVAVNLLGQVLWHDSLAVPAEGDNAAMQASLQALARQGIQQLPGGTELAGVGYSLSGLVNVAQARWVMAARWPRMRNLALGVPEGAPEGATGSIHVVRNTDAQLRARCLRRDAAARGHRSLLLHWGYGIGVSFHAGPGARVDDTAGFGEVGHWSLPGQNKPCHCGHTGCLETVAGLWSIGPSLLGARFDEGMDEIQAADMLRGMDLVGHPVFQQAMDEVVRTVGNLCRVFFPVDMVVSGPFVDNPAAWAAFTTAVACRGTLADLPPPRLEAQSVGHHLELEGAAMPLLLQGLARLLDEGRG